MRYLIFFIPMNERMIVPADDMPDTPPPTMTHPDNPSLRFRFWTSENDRQSPNEFWFYIPDRN